MGMRVTCPNCQHDFEVTLFSGEDSPLRMARRASGLTVNQVAEELGLSAHSLAELERGKMNPRLSTMRKAERLFKKPMDELFPETLDEEDEEENDDDLPAPARYGDAIPDDEDTIENA